MNWDTFYQIAMNYHGQYPIYAIPWAPTGSVVNYAYSDHHPIFDTLIFGAFAQTSDALFGNWNVGVFAYVVLQALAIVFSLAFSIAYAAKLGVSRWAQYTLVVFFAFMPFYAAYAATMVKDSFFSWLYVLYFLLLFEVVLTKGKYLQSKKAFIWFVALACLLCFLPLVMRCMARGRHRVLGLVYVRFADLFWLRASGAFSIKHRSCSRPFSTTGVFPIPSRKRF